MTNAISNLSLSLTAANNIVNAGTISSAANLNLTADNTINNLGAITATQNIAATVASGILTNAGSIVSTAGNITIAGTAAQNILVNNTNGLIQSVLGNINIMTGAQTEKLAMQIVGGDLQAAAINLSNLNGMVEVDVKNLLGPVNISAGGAHIQAETPNLTLGQLNLTGDPTFYNTAGDITLTSDIDLRPVQFAPPGPVALAIVASGSIIGNGISTIDVSTKTNSLGGGSWQGQGSAGAVLLVAGADLTATQPAPPLPPAPTPPPLPDNGNVSSVSVGSPPVAPPPGNTTYSLTINGASTTGGDIKLSNVSIKTQAGVTPNQTAGNNYAAPTSSISGDVTLVAYSGSTNNGNISIGDITAGEWFPTTTTPYETPQGDLSGLNGNVTIVAQGHISTGDIKTIGNYVNPTIYNGTVTIVSAGILMAESTQAQPSVAWPGNTTYGAATIVSGLYPLYSTIGDAFLAPGLSSFTLSVTPNPPAPPAGNPSNPAFPFQPPTASAPPAIASGTVLYIDPQGPNAETVTVASVSGNQITLSAPLTKYHYQTERIMQQAGSVLIYPSAGSVGLDGYFLPPTQNGGTFAPNYAALGSGNITVGTISATQSIQIATTGRVTATGNMSLTQNPNAYSPWTQWPGNAPPPVQPCCPAGPVPPTAVPNTLRYPSINITGSTGISVGKSVSISSAISGCNLCPSSVNMTTNLLVNNGLITAGTATSNFSNSFVNIQSTGDLTVRGSGTFSVPSLSVIELAAADSHSLNINSSLSFSTGAQGLVILNAQGSGGSINLASPATVTVTHPAVPANSDLTPTVININTPTLNLGHGSSISSSADGTIAISSGYTSDPLAINVATSATMTTTGLIMMRSGGNSNVSIAPSSGSASLALNARLSLIVTDKSSVSVSLNGTDSVFFAQNPSGNLLGIAFQPYVGDVVTGTLVYPAFTGYPYWSVLSLLAPIAAAQQYRMVSTYTEQNSSAFVIQAAKQVGLQVSAGVFAKIQTDGSMTPADLAVANSDMQIALYGASKFGNVYDLVVGNEDIVGNAAPGPSIIKLTSLITTAQGLRDGTANPAGGNFTSATLPVTTRQEAGVLNLVKTSSDMVTLVQTVEDHIYGNFYPFFDQSPTGVIAQLLANPSMLRGQFDTLVSNFMTQSLDTNVSNFKQYVVTSIPKILVGETGWATPFPSTQYEPYVGTALPQQNLTWAFWYYPAMQSWSATYTNANQSSTSINTYFDSYNEPWKGVDGANPNNTAVTLSNNIAAGATTINVSSAAAFQGINPLSVMLDPGSLTLQEVQNITKIDTTTNTLTISPTTYAHSSGGSLHAGTPEEPFFGIWKAEGTTSSNSGTYSIYNLTSIHNKLFSNSIPLPIYGPVTRAPYTSSSVNSNSTTSTLQQAPSVNPLLAEVALLTSSINSNIGLVGNTIAPTDKTTVPGGGNDNPPLLPQQTNYFTNFLVGRLAYDSPDYNRNPDLNNNNLAPVIPLPPGNSIFAPSHDLAVQTPMGTVNIGAGSAVMIVRGDSSISIFNLHDESSGAVSLTRDGSTFALPVGRQLSVSSDKNATFSNINTGKIAFRNPQETKIGDLQAFTAEFSIASALTSIDVMERLANSPNDEERVLAKKLFKTAAALAVISKGKQAYQTK
ncbi:MAG: hypothetical protein K2X27_03700 [Candidatus Obscuribacterales bacterium]|nr:hypothetical protein [Candidatus Obscuribacterales bacterium]